jgi:alpha-beta hydrolase superfamily lysophospholipase
MTSLPNPDPAGYPVEFLSAGNLIKGRLFLPEGQGPFPSLLISHGAGEHHRNYVEFCRYLAGRGIASLAVDMRGHGGSEGDRFHVKMAQWTEDLQAALDFLSADPRIHPDRICAFGLSSGGTAILETALLDHRLRALVALDSTVRTSLPLVFDLVLRGCIAIGTVKRWFTGQDLRYPLTKITGSIPLVVDPEVDRRLTADPETLKSSLAFPFPGATEAFYIDTIKRVDRITAPTLVIWGAEDQLDSVETAHCLFAKLRCPKRLEIIPGNGHAGHLDQHRDQVFALAADWVLEHTAGTETGPRLVEGPAARRFTAAEKERWLLPFVRKHGSEALSYATLQDGMEYFITDKGYLAYTFVRHPVFAPQGVCIGLEDPLCAEEDWPALLDAFFQWNPRACFLVISERFARFLRSRGFKVNCMGPEPLLPIQTYNTQGNWKELDLIKRARNEAKRRGVAIRETRLEDLSKEQLVAASSTWMQTKILNTREIWIYARRPVWTSEPDVRKFVAFDKDNRVVGFVFYDPLYRNGRIYGYAANTVRCDETHYGKLATAIHMEAIECFRKEGLETLNLCLAPFVKLGNGAYNDDALCRWYFELCERFGNDIYNFRGLAFHKAKYRGSEIYIYFASRNRFPANEIYLAYLSAGIASSYFKSCFDLLRGVAKGLWRECRPQKAPVPKENLRENTDA